MGERRRLPMVVAAIALVVLPAATWTMASRSEARFTDNVLLGRVRLVTGTLDIDVGSNELSLEAANLAPGDRAVVAITVTNVGSLGLLYQVSIAEDDQDRMAEWLVPQFWSLKSGGEPPDCLSELEGERTGVQALGDSSLPLAPGASSVVCLEVLLGRLAPNEVQSRSVSYTVVVDAAEHSVEDTDG